jgi:hypothetical protein
MGSQTRGRFPFREPTLGLTRAGAAGFLDLRAMRGGALHRKPRTDWRASVRLSVPRRTLDHAGMRRISIQATLVGGKTATPQSASNVTYDNVGRGKSLC